MIFNKTFSRVFTALLAHAIFAIIVSAQTSTHLTNITTTTTTIDPSGATRLETDPVIISRAAEPAAAASRNPLFRFDQLLHSAIGERLGSRYVWGATGPRGFDCSGFVWSSFKASGVDFMRGSARSYWARFSAPPEEEKFKFGTLVFFNGLTHVGIVADEKGFYHASRRKGVVYQEWNKYYLSRIDGFRRVPLPVQLTAAAE
ncbi:MAG TPA: C40 family peptidase [Pyrinomonadaceae bacterium]